MQMVFVMRRMLGFFDDKIPERRSSHAPVQEPGQLQHRITISLSLQSSSIHSPQIAIVTIDACLARIGGRHLTIGGTGENQSMQLLEGLTSVPEFHRQPVQQVRMAWVGAHAAKIIGRGTDSHPEMVLPKAIDDGSPGKWVIRPKNPGCQGHSPVTLRMPIGQDEGWSLTIKDRDGPGLNFLSRL